MYEDVKVTGEVIKKGIALKIRDTFKSDTDPIVYPTVYKEKVHQNLVYPNFFIWTIDTQQTQLAEDTFDRQYLMEIKYTPNTEVDESYELLTDIGNTLMEALSKIDVDIFNGDYVGEDPVFTTKPVKGMSISFKITSDVLIFLVNYKIRVKTLDADGIQMETLSINQNQ